MKRKLTQIANVFIICFILLTFIQCSKDVSSIETSALNPNEIIQLRTFISSTIGTDLIKVTFDSSKNNFTIDGDMIMSLNQARQHYSNSITNKTAQTSKTSQRSYTYLVTAANAANVTIYISPNVSSDWRIAINQAIINWNTINSGISFNLLSTALPNSLIISPYTDTSNTIAKTYAPYANGQPGNLMLINTTHNSIGASQKVETITHEMGHSIGLTHTDKTTYNLIPCTPVLDSGSVMNSIVAPWTNFSPYDIIAISTLYPITVGTTKFYRYRNTVTLAKLCTTNPCELEGGSNNFVLDKDAGYLYTTNIAGTVPLYRYFSLTLQDYLYTTSISTRQLYSYVGIEGYVFTTQQPGTLPLYCYSKSNLNYIRSLGQIFYNHFYTTSSSEVLANGYFSDPSIIGNGYLNPYIIGYVVSK